MIRARVRVDNEDGSVTTLERAESLRKAERLRGPVTLGAPSG